MKYVNKIIKKKQKKIPSLLSKKKKLNSTTTTKSVLNWKSLFSFYAIISNPFELFREKER